MKQLLFLLIPAVLLLGCLPEDERVEPYDRGDLEEGQAEMGVRYGTHLFFDLSTGKFTGSALRTSWDMGICFESEEEGLSLNTAIFQEVAFTEATDLGEVRDDSGLEFLREYPESPLAQLEKTSLEAGKVFVLALGATPNGVLLDTVKCRVIQWAERSLQFEWAPLKESNFFSAEVVSDPEHRLRYFSFSDPSGTVEVAPPDAEWDLWFTTYTDGLESAGEIIPYLVNGVLVNPKGMGVGRLDEIAFPEIGASLAGGIELTDSVTAIGYDWKEFDFSAGTYSIFSGKHYIIKDQAGFWYKLRFVDFYNEAGEKGYPTFEYQLL